jgi:hypothetical protein
MNTLEQTEAPAVALIDAAEVHPLRVLDLDRAKPRLPADSVLVRASDDATGIALLIELAIKMGRPLDELIAAQERIMGMRSVQEFNRAMDGFRGEVTPIPKARWANMQGKNNDTPWGFSYAPLDVIDVHIAPLCKKYQLSHRWNMLPPGASVANYIETQCIVRHVGGHSETTSFYTPSGTNGQISAGQNIAASNTFNKRQALIMAYGLSQTDNFDDETLLRETNQQPPAKAVTPPRRREPAPQDAQRERPAQTEQRPAQQADTRTAGAGVRLASEKQCNLIKVRADRAGVAEADLLRRFNLDSLDAVPGASVDAILEFISKVAP